jgi:hypothetical protein
MEILLTSGFILLGFDLKSWKEITPASGELMLNNRSK